MHASCLNWGRWRLTLRNWAALTRFVSSDQGLVTVN
jgi:hypothetical protein